MSSSGSDPLISGPPGPVEPANARSRGSAPPGAARELEPGVAPSAGAARGDAALEETGELLPALRVLHRAVRDCRRRNREPLPGKQDDEAEAVAVEHRPVPVRPGESEGPWGDTSSLFEVTETIRDLLAELRGQRKRGQSLDYSNTGSLFEMTETVRRMLAEHRELRRARAAARASRGADAVPSSVQGVAVEEALEATRQLSEELAGRVGSAAAKAPSAASSLPSAGARAEPPSERALPGAETPGEPAAARPRLSDSDDLWGPGTPSAFPVTETIRRLLLAHTGKGPAAPSTYDSEPAPVASSGRRRRMAYALLVAGVALALLGYAVL